MHKRILPRTRSSAPPQWITLSGQPHCSVIYWVTGGACNPQPCTAPPAWRKRTRRLRGYTQDDRCKIASAHCPAADLLLDESLLRHSPRRVRALWRKLGSREALPTEGRIIHRVAPEANMAIRRPVSWPHVW